MLIKPGLKLKPVSPFVYPNLKRFSQTDQTAFKCGLEGLMYPNTWSFGREQMATEQFQLALSYANALEWVQTLSDNGNKIKFVFSNM